MQRTTNFNQSSPSQSSGNSALDVVRNEAYATAYATARAEGVKSVRERARGILTHAEAKDRQQLAMSIVFETDLTVEQAAKMLTAAPKQIKGGALASLMAGIKNPMVGVDADINLGARVPGISTAEIYSMRRAQHAGSDIFHKKG